MDAQSFMLGGVVSVAAGVFAIVVARERPEFNPEPGPRDW
jgi:hypothetical protein